MPKHLKTVSYKAILLSMVLGLLGFTIALAASGDLDITFDGDGLATSYAVPSNPGRWDTASSVAIQADGKIVAAGYSYIPSTTTQDFAVLRYNTDGSLDSTFSGDGRLITHFGGKEQASGVAIQANGKIVVAGQVCSAPSTIGACDVALARYNSNGTLDTTFSGDGKQTSDFGGGGNGSFGKIAIQSNGKIVVVGYMSNGTDYDFAIYRYLSSGTLDTTFSGDGKVNIGFGAGRNEFANDVVIQSNGKIIVVGSTSDSSFTNNNIAMARLNAGGSLDTTFSGDGKQVTNFGAEDYGYGVTLQADGKILVAGDKTTTLRSFALVRYNTDGSLDTSFNGTGKRVFSITSGMDSYAIDVIARSNGKIVVIGSNENGSGVFDFAVVRLNSGGTFDTSFSGDGKVSIDFGGNDYALAFTIQPLDGKYVLAGATNDATQSDFALARILP